MRTVRAVSEPTIAGTLPAYRPATGSNPAMDAYAMPSGIENSPVTSPAPTSDGFGFPGAGSSRRLGVRPFTSSARPRLRA
ncbi:hypothetical protein ACH4ON_05605 [Streptomyces eurythermus]|uniref:hypothetical protein n=1 Tax=Streptomyces TaxID=1883 RepID=UPI001FD73F11|nr:hypothetical protein [Streptomyces lavenduligriseus]